MYQTWSNKLFDFDCLAVKMARRCQNDSNIVIIFEINILKIEFQPKMCKCLIFQCFKEAVICEMILNLNQIHSCQVGKAHFGELGILPLFCTLFVSEATVHLFVCLSVCSLFLFVCLMFVYELWSEVQVRTIGAPSCYCTLPNIAALSTT